MAARPRPTPDGAPPVVPDLALHGAAGRAQVLERERARLLRDVQKKKLQLQQVLAQAAGDAQEATLRMRPLVARHGALVRELHELLAELLREGRLDRRERKEVLRLRRLLELEGVLAPLPDDEPEPEPATDPEPVRKRPPAGASGLPPELAGAAPRGQERRSVRELFRQLARAVHPDQARHEPERQRRTEVMKQVTRAYEEGDLAQLLELERAWQREQALAGGADPEQRAAELERVNRELLAQVRSLTRQLRDAKAQARAASAGMLPEELLQQARAELDELEALCEALRRLRDGLARAADVTVAAPRPKRSRRKP